MRWYDIGSGAFSATIVVLVFALFFLGQDEQKQSPTESAVTELQQ